MKRWLCLVALGVCGLCLAQDEHWYLSMKDAELRDVVQEMSAILGTTIVLDSRVKGRISVHSDRELDRAGVRELFYSVLDTHGFAAVADGEQLLIVPASEAKGRSGSEGRSQFVTRVVPLGAASAADLAALLRPLVSANGYLGPSASANALVITDASRNVQRLVDIVQRLDTGANLAHDVVELRQGLATEVARVIEQSLGKVGSEAGSQVLADPRSNRLIIIGTQPARQRLVQLARSLDTGASQKTDNSRVVRLRHGDAAQLAEVLDGIAQQMGQAVPAGAGKATFKAGGEVMVRADQSQNALVLIAPPLQLDTLARIIEQLDQPRAQVLIHAAIVEISGDVKEALGVQWAFSGGSAGGAINFPGTGISIGSLLGKGEVSLPEGAVVGAGSDRFGMLVSALASSSHNNLLSTPSLLTLDNQPAEILVGQNVPFQTGSYTTSGNGADNPFTTVERKDVGISLKILPHINEGATLRLEVEQESSEIATVATGSKDLITNKRALKSTILADDGEIIVIGGLIKDSLRHQESGVPLLRSIPWLGGLFRWRSEVKEKTNLMVFLRPTIVRGTDTLARLSQGSYDQLRGPGEGSPLLPGRLVQVLDAPTVDLRRHKGDAP